MNLDEHTRSKYPYMEYHFAGDPDTWRDPLVGSVIRALGRGWKVAVLARGDGLAFWHLFSESWLEGRLSVVESFESVPSVQLLILDASIPFAERVKIQDTDSIIGKMHVMSSGEFDESFAYNLISRYTQEHLHLDGVVAFTGGGKGKTTSALGWAWQKAQGKPVAVVQWFKEKSSGHLTWSISEHQAPKHLLHPDQLAFYPTGLGFFGSPALDRVKGQEAYHHHRVRAVEGVQLASRLLREREIGALVLDEFVDTLNAVSGNLPQDLLRLEEVRALLKDAVESSLPVVVTGRRVTPEWSEFIATSVEIENLRHPWTHEKRGAVSGLDF